jgi:hypothetical protein
MLLEQFAAAEIIILGIFKLLDQQNYVRTYCLIVQMKLMQTF